MANLTAKQESFIKLMSENEELARRGFELLLARTDYDQFFDPLSEAGLFDPAKNPAPVPAEEKGYVRIPYWSALDYLTAVAKLSGERNDMELANKVMSVIRRVSRWRDDKGQLRENYHTSHKFAAMLGMVPIEAVTADDLDLIPLWLSDRFEVMLVSTALAETVLPRFLDSDREADWDKALIALRHSTALKSPTSTKSGEAGRAPESVIDGYWLRRLVDQHARLFGIRTGKNAADLFVDKIREVFNSDVSKMASRMWRPAVEDHYQNSDYKEIYNFTVEGLRDVLLGWIERDPEHARDFVETLLTDDLDMLRRIAIYTVSQAWESLSRLYSKFVSAELFDSTHIHELYNLLRTHFSDMSDSDKKRTLEAIRQLPEPSWADDPPRSLKRMQRRWLSAIAGNGFEPADAWIAELDSDATLGRVSEHPDFDFYIQSRYGFGASPYSVAELVAFTASNTLVAKLDDFQERDPWNGPTMDGLTNTLEEAASTVAQPFLDNLAQLLNARSIFQRAVISGLEKAWETSERSQKADWVRGWPSLIEFFERFLKDSEFWQVDAAADPQRDWVASAIADCLESGTKNDDHAFAPELFPRAQALIAILLRNATPAEQPSENDPMTQALNTPKGRTVEALFNYALRTCRVDDRTNGLHEKSWASVEPLFNAELDRCENTNYEFSTLCGANIGQLHYMNAKWTESAMGRIFPSNFVPNSICAIDGLGYAEFTRPTYALLLQAGVLERGLRYDLKGRDGRERLLERIAAAYLWGDDSLESPRFNLIFDSGSVRDLQAIIRVFWMTRDGNLSEDQKHRVKSFWQRCIKWCERLPESPIELLSSLSTLASYLSTADGEDRRLLEAVSPHVHSGHNTYDFIDELVRLVPTSPDGVSVVLRSMTEARIPDFDYQDKLKTLLRELAKHGKRQEAIFHAERLRSLGGMHDLFDELTTQ